MSIKKYIILMLGFVIFNSYSYSQNMECGTIEPSGDLLKTIGTQGNPAVNNATVQVFIHIIRQKNGNGGASLSEVINVFANVLPTYKVYGICLSLIGYDYIDNNDFAKNFEKPSCNSCTYNSLIQTNAHSDAIDIYIVPEFDKNYLGGAYYGMANGIVSKALVLIKNLPDAKNKPTKPGGLTYGYYMAHELGHCLGLWHTHHGTKKEGGDPTQCPELVNGTNSDVCGDYVQDTSADPYLINLVDANCNYIGTQTDANGDTYMPNVNNIMSYTNAFCATYFSAGQGLKIRETIANSPLLQACLVNPNGAVFGIFPKGFPTFQNDFTFTASNTLTIGGALTVINPGAKVNCVAENKVIIQSPFIAQYGSHFCAQIGPSCNPVPNCKIITNIPSNNNNDLGTSITSENSLMLNEIIKEEELLQPIFSSNNIIPNPSNGKFEIGFINDDQVEQIQFQKTIAIYNIYGEKIYQSEILSSQSEINLTSQPKGIYFIKIQNGETTQTKKIVIQ